jgi:subfamily B ATP-binding cassette protein MsbA
LADGEGRVRRVEFDETTRRLVLRLWRDWLKPYMGKLLLAMMFMAVVAGATGLYPVLIKYAYSLFKAGDFRIVTLLPAAIILVVTVKSGALYVQTVLTNSVVLRAIADLQKAMFAHLTEADLARLARDTTGSLISRFVNDMALIREALIRTVTNLVRDALTVCALVVAMVYLDWQLSLIVLLFYPLAIRPIVAIGRRQRRVSTETQAHTGDMAALLNESLAGARMVKTYRLEPYEMARAGKTFERLYTLMMRLIRSRTRVEPLLEVMGGIAVAGIIAFAGYRIAHAPPEKVSELVGNFTGFVSALLVAAGPVRAIGTLNAVVQEGLAAVARVFALLDERPAIIDRPGALPLKVVSGQVVFEDVSFTYESGAAALENVSLDVAPGTTAALVGPSGAGKSTIINLIPRLYDVRRGAILIDGQDIRAVTLASLRGAIALVSQDVTLFNDTVRANIALGRLEATNADIEQAARAAAAHDFITALPQGYETIVGEAGAKLSGGQRQRIAIARAMLKDAPLLLLDEATSSLDSESERQVQTALSTLKRGRTTLVIAHRLSTVLDADRIFVLDKGRMVEEGNHGELLRRGGLYARLYKTQFAAGLSEPDHAVPIGA